MQETKTTNYYPYYYNNQRILYAMRKYTYKREMSFITPKHCNFSHTTRFMKAHNVQALQYLFKELKILDGKPFNLYTSVAKYEEGIPQQSMNLATRDNTNWKQNHWKHIVEYDFFIDIDADGDIQKATEETNALLTLLNDYNVPYYLRYSGNGFHILIPEIAFPKRLSYDPYDNKNNIYSRYQQLALFLKDNFLTKLDASIYDSQRQIKLPYSIALYEHKEMVCTPLQDNDLTNFKEEVCTPEYIFQNMPRDILFNQLGDADNFVKFSKVKW